MSADIRTVLANELHQLAHDLALHASGLREGSEQAAADCLGLCERLGQAAGMIEAPALQEVAVFLISNIPALLGDERLTQAPAELCAELELCLLEGPDSSRWSRFTTNLADAQWPASMDAEAAAEIAQGLRPLSLEESRSAAAEHPPELSPADLCLSAPQDVGGETLQAFFHEAPLQAARLNELFVRFTPEQASAQIAQAQRLAHTLKGSSSLCGLNAISHLAHALEALLERLAAGGGRVRPAARSRLIEAGDMIEHLIELAGDAGAAPDSLPELIASLYQDVEDTDAAVPRTVDEPVATTETPAADLDVEPRDAPVEQTPTLNVPIALIDDNLQRAGELNIGVGRLSAQVSGALERAARLSQQLALVQSQVYELETLVDARGTPALRRAPGREGGPVDLAGEFDPLELDEYTSLHSLSRAFAESTLDSRELARELADELLKLQNLLAQHARLGRELTHAVMNARMAPVAMIASRLERIVRQTARRTGRDAALEIQGRELSIDTDILNGLVEPLMHALRNAVDHGVEPPQERLACGKPQTGSIVLSFRRVGAHIEVSCRDDGRGLDYAAIRRRAVECGVLKPADQPTATELASLIFLPGFSTRTEASSVSGRGVGMDAVRASIERLKGSVRVESEPGAGCTLTFRLPLSLTAAHALFVAVGEGTFGLLSTAVDQVLYSDAGRVMQLGEQHAFEYGGRIAPLYSLAALLGLQTAALDDLAAAPHPLVLVSGDAGPVALAVDRALDSRQIVIKGLSPLLPALPGVAGACVLPDGGVGVILEVRELLRNPAFASAARQPVGAAEDATPRVRRALVVDDSLSARRTLATLLSDCGYEVAGAVDGLDAIARIEERTPDIVLVDLEMPRMNGLELTAHLRNRPETRSTPVVMITSRGADKHRTQALRAGVTEYFTKPYLEQELLDRLYVLAPP